MVREYKRKTERGKWDEGAMMQGVLEVVNGRMGYKRAAQAFNIPQTTLERKVKKFKLDNGNAAEGQYIFKERLGPISSVFSLDEEEELVSYLKTMESKLFGLSTNDLKRLAFQLAEKNNKQHCFNNSKREAGKDWVRGFLKRNPTLSIRKPEPTSIARAMAFNKENVSKFYTLLGELYDNYKFTPDRIYNCDESGISSVSKNTCKILASKGKKQVGSLSSADRGKTVSVEVCMSASGVYMPPLLVYPRQRMKPELLNNCSPGMWAECHVSGWMQKDIFEKWFDRFVEFSGATKERPVLLLLDGHSTHVQSLNIIDKARANGVVILCFPPHCTHRLQPLDVAFMKPLSVYYDQEMSNWLRSNPGKAVTMNQIAEILGNAFMRAATMTTAVNGFKSTGIWPLNPNIFPDSAYAAASTTDRPMSPAELLQQAEDAISSDPNEAGVDNRPIQIRQVIEPNNDNVSIHGCTGCSHWEYNDGTEIENTLKTCQSPANSKERQTIFAVSPDQVIPVPYVGRKNVRENKHKKGKTVVVTSSPYKLELENSNKIREDKETKMKLYIRKKALFKEPKSSDKKKTINTFPKKATIKKSGAKKKQQTKEVEEKITPDEDVECLYCGYLYSQSVEGWVRCTACEKWAHCSCAGEEDNDDESRYICEFCKQDQT